MPHYRQVGDVPPKRHTQHRGPDRRLYYEELFGEDGFSSDSALLYHRHVPAAIVGSVAWEPPVQEVTANRPLLPRHFKLHDLFADEEWKRHDVVTGRRVVVGNDDVRIAYVAAGEASPLYRNAVADECVYVEAGTGQVETSFGGLDVRTGDYVVLPRGVTHRWVPSGRSALHCYVIETMGHLRPPARYLSPSGQFLEQAPYCERDLHAPEEPLLVDEGETPVLVKHRDGGSVVTCAHHPFDVVGWDGCLYPFTFNVEDFEPLTGRVHQPPPVHQVFEAPNVVICNFVPRKVDYHPLAIPVPYYHSNIDTDEVLFYCGGDYAARRGSAVGLGSLSLHPAGVTHGPQPGAYESTDVVEQVDELAVMVDAFRPLGITADASRCEDAEYAWSWHRNEG